MAKLASRTVETRVGIQRRNNGPCRLSVVNIVEEVKRLHAEIETVFAARVRGPKHSARSATAAASAAKSTGAQASARRSATAAATSTAASVRRPAAGRSALSRAVISRFQLGTNADRFAHAQIDCHGCGSCTAVDGQQLLAWRRGGIETSKTRRHILRRTARTEAGGCDAGALIKQIVQWIARQGDVVRTARLEPA